MVFKKYKVADNAMAKLALPLTETTKTISIKDAINIPEGWERIATLVKVAGNEVIKMEKVIVKSRTENVLQVERGFESNPLQRETNDLLCLNVTAEVIRDLQNAVAEIDVNNKESLSNKKAKIVWNHTSNLFYPTVKAVWDWVTGLLNKKADLVNGKVPANQLPEVSKIDESNLVHKSWDEEIGWRKIFNSTDPITFKVKPWDYSAVRFKENNNEIGSIQAFSPTRFQDFRKGSLEITGQGNNKITIRPWDRDCMTFTSQGEVEWKWQNRTGWRERYTPTLSWDTWWGATFSDTQGRYKVIGKFCFVQVRGIIWNKGTCGWSFKVSLPKLAIERFSIPLAWWIQSIWGNIWTPKAVPLLYRDQIRLAGVLWGHRDTTRSEISVNDFFVFNWCYEIE